MIAPTKVRQSKGSNNSSSVSKAQPHLQDDDWMEALRAAEKGIVKATNKTRVAPKDNPARNTAIIKQTVLRSDLQLKMSMQDSKAAAKSTPAVTIAAPPFAPPPPPPPLPVASTVLIKDAEMAQHVMQKRALENRVVTKSAIKRVAGGEVWEDSTMADWDRNDYRLFVGNLGYEASDDLLVKTFGHYPSFKKARVVRDKKTGRCKGFGFLSFGNAEDYIKATKEFNGKYVGNRPIKLTRSKWEKRQFTEVMKEAKKKRKLEKMLKD